MSRKIVFECDLIANADNLIEISGITIRADGVVAEPSTIDSIACKIATSYGGSAITNSDISMSAVSGFTDFWQGTFPNTVSLTPGTEYWVHATITANTNKIIPLAKKVVARSY